MTAIIKDRELIAQKLSEIAAENGGRITPDLVVSEAQNPDSILHNLFEWDDAIAGHYHRLSQARQIITSVRVVVTTENRKISTVYYVRDPAAEPLEQGYVSVDKLRTDSDLAKESIVMEFSRASSHLNRAKLHAEALGMASDIDVILDDLNRIKEAVKV